jgi:hypothetical protein
VVVVVQLIDSREVDTIVWNRGLAQGPSPSPKQRLDHQQTARPAAMTASHDRHSTL